MKRVAVVTGAGSGIGRAAISAFRDAGWRFVGIDVRVAGRATSRGRHLRADVSSPSDVAAAFRTIASRERRVDALINCAAIQRCGPLRDMSVEEWDAVMDTNVRSVFLTTRHALPLMRRGSAIVNVSSVHAIATSSNLAAYAASKGAVLALTRAMALELAPLGIRVNALLPGAVDTPMLRAGLDRGHTPGRGTAQRKARLAEKTPLGRIGKPAELASAALFLADPRQSSFMSGQALVVDGGATTRLSTE